MEKKIILKKSVSENNFGTWSLITVALVDVTSSHTGNARHEIRSKTDNVLILLFEEFDECPDWGW